jgi:hypothetical protein
MEITIYERDVKDVKGILHPAIAEAPLSVLFAKPGTGSTNLTLYLTAALGAGWPVFSQCVPEPRAVLCIDGKLGAARYVRRFEAMASLLPADVHSLIQRNVYLSSVNAEALDLRTEEGQQVIEERLRDAARQAGKSVDLLVLDDLNCLVNSADTPASWRAVSSWFRELQERRIAVLLLHRLNKSGQRHGAQLVPNLADNVFHLEREEAGDNRSIAFRIVNIKGRDLSPADRKPVHVLLCPDAQNPSLRYWTDGDSGSGQPDMKR